MLTATPATAQRPRVAPANTSHGSYRAARFAAVTWVMSPHSAMNTTAKLAPATRRNDDAGPPWRAASAPSWGPTRKLVHHKYADPARKSAATTASTIWWGSSASRRPAVTAMAMWIANARAAPAHTHAARYRVLRTSEANIDLSGNSARKVIAKAIPSTAAYCIQNPSVGITDRVLTGRLRPEKGLQPKVSSTTCRGPVAGRRSAGMSASPLGTTPLRDQSTRSTARRAWLCRGEPGCERDDQAWPRDEQEGNGDPGQLAACLACPARRRCQPVDPSQRRLAS